jgi:hypothetical protein
MSVVLVAKFYLIYFIPLSQLVDLNKRTITVIPALNDQNRVATCLDRARSATDSGHRLVLFPADINKYQSIEFAQFSRGLVWPCLVSINIG